MKLYHIRTKMARRTSDCGSLQMGKYRKSRLQKKRVPVQAFSVPAEKQVKNGIAKINGRRYT